MSLIGFDEWHVNYSLTTQLNWFRHDLNYYKYYNWSSFLHLPYSTVATAFTIDDLRRRMLYLAQ